jgi:ferredoxin--NADP+ reductase
LNTLECGIVFRSIGYRGSVIPGVPFEHRRGVFPNAEGRILEADAPMRGMYAVGWIKRGPSGTIGVNRADSIATITALLADKETLLKKPQTNLAQLSGVLDSLGIRPVPYSGWLSIDAQEVGNGRLRGKPREKFTRIPELLTIADAAALS